MTVTLRTLTGTLSTVTDASGLYTFTDLITGTYVLTFTAPAGYAGSPQDIGSDLSDSDPSPVTGAAIVPVYPGDVITTADAGLWRPSTISGTVFADFNNNGVLDPGELPIPGTVLTLSGTSPVSGVVTLVAVTGPDGTYVFPLLPPGVYTVTEQQPAEWVDNTDYPGNSGGSVVPPDSVVNIVLTSGTTVTGVDFTERGVTVGDRVWEDLNHNGQQDPGEPGIAGATVSLQTVTGTLTTVTDANGIYTFTNLPINTPLTSAA